MEKISIITITYNNAQGLEKTIGSVTLQDYPDKEYIVIDGGSKDDTPSVLNRLSGCIDICISEPDDGIYDALNKGVKLATGRWIICMNAGDVFAENDVLKRIFSKNIPAGKRFVYSDSLMEYASGRQLLRVMDRSKGDVFHQSAIYERSLHDEYGYYIVTHPYTVSDLMFFLAVPEKYYYKTDVVISKASFGGASSQGLWCPRSAMMLKVAYRMENIHKMYCKYILMSIKAFVKKALGIRQN